MKQRLGVAAALLKDPELVVLDEPTNGLDPAGMRDMRRLIRDLGASGRTVLLSSHLLGEVQQICDRVGRHRPRPDDRREHRRGAARPAASWWSPRRRPTSPAAQLEAMPGVERVRSHDGLLRVRADDRHTADINRVLVAAGVAVTELRRDERQLEDVFFEMTDHTLTTETRVSKEIEHV